MKPPNTKPLDAAISRASAMASAGVSTPARLRPVSHSTTTDNARPEDRAAEGSPGFRPGAVGGGRMRYRAQARRGRNPSGSYRAGARDRRVERLGIRRLHALSDRDRLG